MNRKLCMSLGLVCIGTIAATLVYVGSCKRAPATTQPASSATAIVVGYVPVTTTLPNWVAADSDFASQYGLKVKMQRYANSNLMLLALVNGEIQATSVCADEPLLARAAQGKLDFEIYMQEILSADRVFDAIIVKNNAPYQSLKDLDGKTIACFPGSQLRAYLQIILRSRGIEPDRVKVLELAPPAMLPAIESGTVDAAFALEPMITLGRQRGLTRTLIESPIVTDIGGGKSICAASFLISRAWADAHPQAADGFVRSVHDATERIERDYATYAKRYPEFTPVPAEFSHDVVITRFARNDEPDISGLNREVDILTQAKVVSGGVDGRALIYRWRTPQKGMR